jgi:hypothetical protein
MAEPPALAEEAIAGALEAGFGVRVAGLVFLPVGSDAASWAYRVEVAGAPSWFLKVRAGGAAMPGAAVPAHLHRHGVPLVRAPLPSGGGAPFVVVDRFALALYPLLDAATGAEVGLSPGLTPALGQETRRAALEGLMDLFEPGNIVDLANRFAGRFGPG